MSRSLPVFVFLPLLLTAMMIFSSVVSLPTTSSGNSKNSANVPDHNRSKNHDSYSDAKLEYEIETETEISSDSLTTDETPKQFLGSSVVTSVSVVMNPKNISKSFDSLQILNPEKYEFYTLNKNGEVIKKTMTLNEIRRVVAMDNGFPAELRDNQNSYDLYEQQKIDEVMEKLKSILQEETVAYESDQQKNASKLNELVSSFDSTTVAPWLDNLPEQRTTVATLDLSDPITESDLTTNSSARTTIVPPIVLKTQTTLSSSKPTTEAAAAAATTAFSPVAENSIENQELLASTSSSQSTTISPVNNEESAAAHHSTFSYYVPVSLIHPSALTASPSSVLPVEQKTIYDASPTTEFSPMEVNDVQTESINAGYEDNLKLEQTTAEAERELESESESEPEPQLQKENDEIQKSETKTADTVTEATFTVEQEEELQFVAENEKNEQSSVLELNKEQQEPEPEQEQEQEQEQKQQSFDTNSESDLKIDHTDEHENVKNEQLPNDVNNQNDEHVTTESSVLASETTEANTSDDNSTSEPYATDTFELDDIVSQVIDQINNDVGTTVISEPITTVASIPTSQSSEPIVESNHPVFVASHLIDHEKIATTVSAETVAEEPVADKENELIENEKNEDEVVEPIEQSSPLPSSPLPSSPSSTMWQLISKTDHLQKKRIENFSPSKSSDLGLESTLEKMDNNKKDFIKLCNELAFRYWYSIMSTMKNPNLARSVVMSPFAITSTLSMIFLAARGQTTTEMNRILKLDGAFTFNPHYLFKTVTDSLQINHHDGILNSALVRELFSDRVHGELLNFYKDRVKFFYDGYVEEVDFTTISDIIRRRTNLFIKTRVRDSALEYIYSNTITLRSPLAAFTATIFQTDCSDASINGRDGEMYFIVLPSMRQRRLIQIPAVVHKSNFLLGYEPQLDTIVASVQHSDASNISTVFIMPSRQSLLSSKFGPIDDLLNLEKQLIEDPSIYNLLLRTLAKRDSMEIQLPRFSHRSIINSTEVLWKMGFNELLTKNRANLQGLGSLNEQLYLSDLMQVNSFTNCANQFDELHREDDAAVSDRQKKDSDQITRLRFNRPFLYFVRHNPTGLIVHMGRFNPRLVV